MSQKQDTLFELDELSRGSTQLVPPKGQLLKWIGNKQRMAARIASFFPAKFQAYHEPFLGSGALLATVAPERGFGSDCFGPLMEIWSALSTDPTGLVDWYRERWRRVADGDKRVEYERIKASFNAKPNGADLLFLARSCYGGVVRFRKRDGFMSTPCGAHSPISPESFAVRVDRWRERVSHVAFDRLEFEDAFERAESGDFVYCDPPYSDSQAILYGAQEFRLSRLMEVIGDAKERGVRVALSIDGSKRSGDTLCDVPVPAGVFEREEFILVGKSQLKRFQMAGKSLESEIVADRLLLTY